MLIAILHCEQEISIISRYGKSRLARGPGGKGGKAATLPPHRPGPARRLRGAWGTLWGTLPANAVRHACFSSPAVRQFPTVALARRSPYRVAKRRPRKENWSSAPTAPAAEKGAPRLMAPPSRQSKEPFA
jgi:hypothetical protein